MIIQQNHRASYRMFGAITPTSKRVEPINRKKYGTINKINLKYAIDKDKNGGRRRKTKPFFIGIIERERQM